MKLNKKHKNSVKNIKRRFGVTIYQVTISDLKEHHVSPLSNKADKEEAEFKIAEFKINDRPLSNLSGYKQIRDLRILASINFRKELHKYDYRTFNKVPMNIYTLQSLTRLKNKSSGYYQTFSEKRKMKRERKKQIKNMMKRKLCL